MSDRTSDSPLLRVSILQYDIAWENKAKNVDLVQRSMESLHGNTDVLVLPEMFSTGFSMQSYTLAEPVTGATITTLQAWAIQYNIAITGSYIASDNGMYYNRGFFLTPQNEAYYYDKRHLFRMGDEREHFSPGRNKLIIPYRGWNICLLVCYDLRFPVWSRNVNNEYDLLIYAANWPASRRRVWDTLLPARALENMSYVCGVNRIGTDGNGLNHDGGSIIYSAKGDVLATAPDHTHSLITTELNLSALQLFREKFPAWKDADTFLLK